MRKINRVKNNAKCLKIRKVKFTYIMHSDTVRTSQRTQCASIKKTNLQMMYREIRVVVRITWNSQILFGKISESFVLNLAVRVITISF